MSLIKVLPEELASQIAAGEVVERPSSVVKELLENSIDSGADNIEIRIQGGGKRKIRILDNGVGMSAEDLALCIRRHATSKITSISDLYAVTTLGFRGEALPSIASVARLRIQSRLHDSLVGNVLTCEGGGAPEITEIGCPPGTMVEVRDLFFNVPVRRKFLKSDGTEAAHVLDVIERTAFPHTRIRVFVVNEEKEVLLFPASEDPAARIAAVLGKDTAEKIMILDTAAGSARIKAYLAPGDTALQRADGIYTYLNRRHVRDRTMLKAVTEGYGKRILKGQYPKCIILLEMPPGTFDVNVHPTKQEVRFRDPQSVFSFIAGSVSRCLERRTFIISTPDGSGGEGFEKAEQLSVLEPPAVYTSGASLVEGESKEGCFQSLRIIGQLAKTYILCENKDGLVMIDQHAAHERVLYESLRDQISSRRVPSQAFLLPVQIELSRRDTETAIKNGEALSCLGFELEHFGGSSFVLKSAPAVFSPESARGLVPEILQRLAEGRLSSESVMDRVLCTMACHGAVRANIEMRREEMEQLLRQLEDAGLPLNCPHGRPIFKVFTHRDLERIFKRIV